MSDKPTNTAILLPAHMRTFAQTWDNQYWQVYRHLPDPHFFVSCVDDENADSVNRILERYPKEKLHVERIKQPDTLLEPAWTEEKPNPYTPAPFRRNGTNVKGVSDNQGLVKAFWHLDRLWTFICAETQNGKHDFDQFFLSRGDYHFHSFDPPFDCPYPDECFISWFGNFGGSTGIGIFGRLAIKAYLQTYRRLDELMAAGCPTQAESIVHAAMLLERIQIRHTLLIDWCRLGAPYSENGETKQNMIISHPLPNEIALLAGHMARRSRGTP